MLIGAVIGLAVYSVLVVLNIAYIQHKVDRHNSALNGALARLKGRARVRLYYGQIVIKGIAFVSIGAVIGYFI